MSGPPKPVPTRHAAPVPTVNTSPVPGGLLGVETAIESVAVDHTQFQSVVHSPHVSLCSGSHAQSPCAKVTFWQPPNKPAVKLLPTSMQALAPAVTAASKHQKHGRDPESGADAQVEHEVRWLHGWDRAAAKSKKATIW